jgi:CrcB protein
VKLLFEIIGTFIINISGCLFLGWFSTILSTHLAHNSGPWLKPNDLRLMIAVGFTGAYTTFSTFEVEAHGLLEHGHTTTGLTYLIASLLVGLLAVRVGAMLAQ